MAYRGAGPARVELYQLSRLGLSRVPAWFAGAVFVIHSCLPESTVWIAGRFDLLATLCFLSDPSG